MSVMSSEHDSSEDGNQTNQKQFSNMEDVCLVKGILEYGEGKSKLIWDQTPELQHLTTIDLYLRARTQQFQDLLERAMIDKTILECPHSIYDVKETTNLVIQNRAKKCWSNMEDMLLVDAILKYGKQWQIIWNETNGLQSRTIGSLQKRTYNQKFQELMEKVMKDRIILDAPHCIDGVRHMNHISKKVKVNEDQKKLWSNMEDMLLVDAILKYGKQWQIIWNETNGLQSQTIGSLKTRIYNQKFQELMEKVMKDRSILDAPHCIDGVRHMNHISKKVKVNEDHDIGTTLTTQHDVSNNCSHYTIEIPRQIAEITPDDSKKSTYDQHKNNYKVPVKEVTFIKYHVDPYSSTSLISNESCPSNIITGSSSKFNTKLQDKDRNALTQFITNRAKSRNQVAITISGPVVTDKQGRLIREGDLTTKEHAESWFNNRIVHERTWIYVNKDYAKIYHRYYILLMLADDTMRAFGTDYDYGSDDDSIDSINLTDHNKYPLDSMYIPNDWKVTWTNETIYNMEECIFSVLGGIIHKWKTCSHYRDQRCEAFTHLVAFTKVLYTIDYWHNGPHKPGKHLLEFSSIFSKCWQHVISLPMDNLGQDHDSWDGVLMLMMQLEREWSKSKANNNLNNEFQFHAHRI